MRKDTEKNMDKEVSEWEGRNLASFGPHQILSMVIENV